MFERLERSWLLVKQSWSVLQQDRELLIFPVLSVITSLTLVASFAVPFFMLAIGGQTPATEGDIHPVWFGVGFVLYVGLFFVTYFFNVAIMHCAAMRLDGGDPTVADGLRGASARAGKILQWAAISALVGIIIRSLEERLGLLGRLIMSLLGAAFSVVSAFTVPVLVFEDLGVTDSTKRAMDVLKKTWGEGLVGQTGINIVFGWLTVPGVLLLFLAFWLGGQASVAVASLLGTMAICYMVLLGVISSTLTSIFQVALYRFATQKSLGNYYSPELLRTQYARK